MAKINVKQFFFTNDDSLVVLDDKGRFWMYGLDKQWKIMAEVPDEPEPQSAL